MQDPSRTFVMSDLSLNSPQYPEENRRPSISHLASPSSHVDFDVMSRVREASYSQSPLAELLQDPYLIRSLTKPRKTSRRRPSASSVERGRKHDRKHYPENDTENILTIVIAEEERQGNHLKALLRSTADRLETEIRRTELAESRSEIAESRVRELQARMSTANALRRQAESDAEHSREEARRYQMQLEVIERETHRLRSNVVTLTRQKDDAERESNKAKDQAREYLQRLREYEAREEGREEGRRIGLQKGYNAGWEECWPVAHAEGHVQGFEAGHREGFDEGHSEGYDAGRLAGFEEGRKKGKQDGISEGIEKGRKEERDRALETDGSVYDRNERTHRWIRSVKHPLDQIPALRSTSSRGRMSVQQEEGDRANDIDWDDSPSLVTKTIHD